MISNDTIKQLVNKYQTYDVSVEREYFQHLFLSYFYQQSQTANIFFKGGTALRIIYESPRFSEDLDFNSAYIDTKGIENLIVDTLEQMEKEGVKFTLKEATPTSGGFLAIVIFEGFNRPVEIKFDISLREEEKKGEVTAVINDYVPQYNLIAVTETQLVVEKMRALFDRQKPRDFYDLYFILRKQLPMPSKGETLKKALEILKTIQINFEAELKQYLPKSQWAIIRDFKATLEREIRKYI